MKKFYILIFGLFLAYNIQAQNYVPLLIDSLYSWSWSSNIHGDTTIQETWAGFSYDSNDSLIQRRGPDFRMNYSYEVDTVYLLSEILDANNSWNLYVRITSAYDNGKIVSRRTERLADNAFENSSLYTYFYNDAQLDTMYLLQHWDEGVWVNFYKKENEFNANGNRIEEAEYYRNSNGEFEYSRGRLFEYDDANHKIEEIWVNASANGPSYSGKVNWVYGNDNLVDTISICHFGYPDNQTCRNVSMSVYDYMPLDTTIENEFRWTDEEWKYIGKELTFEGQGVYSSKPDSILSYYFSDDAMVHVPLKRRYLQYEDLGNDKVYFKEELYWYQEATDEWMLTLLKEEWYTLKMTLEIEDGADPQGQASIFPNPCKIGENLTLNKSLGGNEEVEILVFNMQGQLVSTNVLINQPLFQAPMNKGVYTVLIRENGKSIGVSKLVVVE